MDSIKRRLRVETLILQINDIVTEQYRASEYKTSPKKTETLLIGILSLKVLISEFDE